LIVGEIVPVALMIPLVLPLVQGGWRAGLAMWSLPVLAIAILTAVLAPRARRREGDALVAAIPWLPDWNDPLVWRLGFILASVNRCISAPIPSCRVSWPTPAIPI